MISDDDPFGAHGGSVPAEACSARARWLSSTIAKGLSAEAAPEKLTHRGSEQRQAAPLGLSHEEMQRKIEILMANLKLWQSFKQYLAESDAKTTMGTQMVLREFIAKNEEIALEDAAKVEQTRRSGGIGRNMLMGAVNSLTSELEAEEVGPSPPRQQNSTPASSSTGANRVADAAHSSFTNASSMGMRFLHKAGEVVTSSISGLEKEAEVSIEEANESFSSLTVSNMNASSNSFHTLSSDFVGILNEWFGDEAIDDIKEEEDEEEEDESYMEGKNERLHSSVIYFVYYCIFCSIFRFLM